MESMFWYVIFLARSCWYVTDLIFPFSFNSSIWRTIFSYSVCTAERTGIVIELKYADDGNLEKACAEALEQIEEKKYAHGLKRWGTKKILKYGIAFWEKECMVVMA